MSTRREAPPGRQSRQGPDVSEESSPLATDHSPSGCNLPQNDTQCNVSTHGRIRDDIPTPIEPHAVYTLNEAARLLRIRPRKLRDLASTGHPRRCPHTRHIMFLGEELLRVARGERS